MKLLVIGGTGNISRWIVRHIEHKGYDITVVNRQNTKADLPAGVRQLKADRKQIRQFEHIIEQAGRFDCVLDMLVYEPEEARSALRCFEGKTGHYILCSTVDVYGKHRDIFPVPLEQPVNASASFPYAYKKMEIEHILRNNHRNSRLPLTIIRPGFTYSEGWSPLLTCFGGQSYHLDRVNKNRPVILQDGGNMIWNCSHSRDVAAAFAGAIENTNTIGKDYNVTGDETLSWRDMHLKVASLLQAPKPQFLNIPTKKLVELAPEQTDWCVENFQYNCIFDNSAAKRDLGYQYTIPFEKGASACLDYLMAKNGIEDYTRYPFYDQVIERWRKILQDQAFQFTNPV